MSSTIPLAKGLNIGELHFPVFLSEKLDGVPIRIDIAPVDHEIGVAVQSRQGKPVPSVENLVEDFVNVLMENGFDINRPVTFVAEVTHKTLTNFKDISGVVRKKEPQEDLILNFFDYVDHNDAHAPFFMRTQTLANILGDLTGDVRYIQQVKITEEVLTRLVAEWTTNPPDVEGYIVRSFDAQWKPNTRHWDYQKIVIDPTVDLYIIGAEEAVSQEGEPLGMAGRLIADYHDADIGIGPGKMTHKERKEFWQQVMSGEYDRSGYMIATIKYKRDPSYGALRQPTFQHWRPEKTEVSYD